MSFSSTTGMTKEEGALEISESGRFMSSKFRRVGRRLGFGREKEDPNWLRGAGAADPKRVSCGRRCWPTPELRMRESIASLVSFWLRGLELKAWANGSEDVAGASSVDGSVVGWLPESNFAAGGVRWSARRAAEMLKGRWERLCRKSGLDVWGFVMVRREDGRSRSSPSWREPIVCVGYEGRLFAGDMVDAMKLKARDGIFDRLIFGRKGDDAWLVRQLDICEVHRKL